MDRSIVFQMSSLSQFFLTVTNFFPFAKIREYKFFVYKKESMNFPRLFFVRNFYVFLFPRALDTIDAEFALSI